MNNQPAFPMVAKDKTGMIINMGMSMRDYFAAQALAALIVREGQESFVVEEITITAYQYADSMLEVR
jgi:hypothetical protein